MKWFKHHSDMSLNDKIGKLEAEFGLIGYAVYLKILELCALNWDEISDPQFSFHSSRIHSLLNMKAVRTELVLNRCSVLNLFQFFKNEKEYVFIVPKLAEVKKRYEKKSEVATSPPRGNPTPNKKGDKELKKGDKDKEEIGGVLHPVPFENNLSSQVDFAKVSDLFNRILGGQGNIQFAQPFCPPMLITDLKATMSVPEFQKIEFWEKYFQKASQSNYLKGKGKIKFTANLLWLVKLDNAYKVLSGAYDNGTANEIDEEYLERMKALELKYDGVGA